MIRRVFNFLLPPQNWRAAVILSLGFLAGVLIFLVYISRAHSYLSNEPSTCVNCHIMTPFYVTWYHSSHREWATCVDCHVPHDNIFRTYAFKAKDGLRHATIFTLRLEPQAIFIHESGRSVVQENCIRCHGDLLRNEHGVMYFPEMLSAREQRRCVDCHRQVPHGGMRGLSVSREAMGVPLPASPVPRWLKALLKNN